MSGDQIQLVGTRISQCAACTTPLPLCECANPEELRQWFCSRCGAEYSAILAADYSIAELRGIRPERISFDPPSIRPVAPEMLAYSRQFGDPSYEHVEKRSSRRHAVIATLTAMEFDQQLQPVDSPFQTVCRNLSTGGIRLLNEHSIRSDFLVIELSAPGGLLIQTLSRVLRCQPLDAYHDIGIEFVTKLADAKT